MTTYFDEINPGIIRRLPAVDPRAGQKVLDVGCGNGALAEAIRQKGYEVWGIESNPAAIALARRRVRKLLTGDLTQTSQIRKALGSSRFDYLVISDVLEHVLDPLAVLRFYATCLKPQGRLLLSVPNVAVWTVRLGLLFGRFNYQDSGTLDRTHLRFFTFATAKALLRDAGFQIAGLDYTPHFSRALLPLIKRWFFPQTLRKSPPSAVILDSPAYRFYCRWVYPLEYILGWWWKALFAFRIILIGSRHD